MSIFYKKLNSFFYLHSDKLETQEEVGRDCENGKCLSKFTHKLASTHAQKQAERLKSRERRPEVNRVDGQWAWIGFLVNRLHGQ